MENKGQRIVARPTKGRLPSAPQHTQGQANRMLGIQDQGMVVKRGYSYHETQEVLRMFGENYLGHTNGSPGVAYGESTCVTSQCRPGGLWIRGGLDSGGRFL